MIFKPFNPPYSIMENLLSTLSFNAIKEAFFEALKKDFTITYFKYACTLLLDNEIHNDFEISPYEGRTSTIRIYKDVTIHEAINICRHALENSLTYHSII